MLLPYCPRFLPRGRIQVTKHLGFSLPLRANLTGEFGSPKWVCTGLAPLLSLGKRAHVLLCASQSLCEGLPWSRAARHPVDSSVFLGFSSEESPCLHLEATFSKISLNDFVMKVMFVTSNSLQIYFIFQLVQSVVVKSGVFIGPQLTQVLKPQ